MSPLREFEGCRQRIERAQAHKEALARAWNAFIADEPYSAVLHIDDSGAGSLCVEPQYDPLPTEFALELGEMLYQLRAALDGVVYGAAIRDGGSDPPQDFERLEFPVCSSSQRFSQVRQKMGPLAEKRQRIIESVQPYQIPADLKPEYMIFNFNRALAILHDWARKDRHRQLHVVGSWASNRSPLIYLPPPANLTHWMVTGDGMLEHDSEIARFKIDGFVRGMNVKANPNLSIDIAVNESPEPCADNDTLGNRIRGMFVMVRTIVGGIEESFSEEAEG